MSACYYLENPTYYIGLTLTDGKTYRFQFEPGEVVFDRHTDIAVSMHVEADGEAYDLILLPEDQTQLEALELIADILGDLGASVLSSQFKSGNQFFDTITDLIIGKVVDEGIAEFKLWLRQTGGSYYDVRTGELFVLNTVSKYDVEYD